MDTERTTRNGLRRVLDGKEISDLPEKLSSQLTCVRSRAERESYSEQIICVIKNLGMYANLDEILVDLYNKYGSIKKRRCLRQQLHLMKKMGLIDLVPGNKSVFTIKE